MQIFSDESVQLVQDSLVLKLYKCINCFQLESEKSRIEKFLGLTRKY